MKIACMKKCLHALLMLRFILIAESFADWMTNDFCDRELAVGQVIMNNLVEASDSRNVRVYRGGDELTTGDAYHPSETLTVSINDTTKQYVYEANGGATFEKGGCGGKRIANKPKAVLVMPAAGVGEIKIVAGWSPGHQAVSLSPAFLLVPFKAVLANHTSVPIVEAKKEDVSEKREAYDAVPDHVNNMLLQPSAMILDRKRLANSGENTDNRDLGESDPRKDSSEDVSHQVLLEKSTPPEPQEDFYAHNLHSDERALLAHDSETKPADEMVRSGDSVKRGPDKDILDLSRHPHSAHEHDHDRYDIRRKAEADHVRDRLFLQGKEEELGERYRMEHERMHRKHLDRMEARFLFQGRGEELMAGRDITEAIERDLEEEIMHRTEHESKASAAATRRKSKVALRGSMTNSQYVQSHPILFLQIALGGVVLLFFLFRLFYSRFRIQRCLRKMKGLEDK